MSETAFGYFPDYDVQWDIKYERRYKTQIKESKTGKEQRRRLFPTAAADGNNGRGGYGIMTASSDAYTPTERVAVVEFLNSLDGAFRAFYVFKKDSQAFNNYFVANVITAVNYIIPFKEATVVDVKIDGVSIAFTVSVGVGTGGEDRVNFTPGAQTGALTIDLTAGRERWLVRAVDDSIVESFIANVITNNTVVPLAFRQVR